MNGFTMLAGAWASAGALAMGLLTGGCASGGGGDAGRARPAETAPAAVASSKFKATDGRTIDIGKATRADGGWRYDNPHLEKGKCWIADGFNFTGFDAIYLAPPRSTAKFPDKPEDKMVHDLAKERLVTELSSRLNRLGLFGSVVAKETDLQAGARALTLEQTITEFSKGGGGARYWVGLYGGGQPVLRVQGKVTAGGKTLFTYEARRSGVSGGARMGGVFMKDEDIQSEDIRSLVTDLTDFMAAVAGKYPAK